MVSQELLNNIKKYIKDNYETPAEIETPDEIEILDEIETPDEIVDVEENTAKHSRMVYYNSILRPKDIFCYETNAKLFTVEPYKELHSFIDENKTDNFSDTLRKCLDEKGITPENWTKFYQSAGVSAAVWSNIMTKKDYVPNKKTAISLAFALKLNLEETNKLLASGGLLLSGSVETDLVLRYCIVYEIRDFYDIDEIMVASGQTAFFYPD